MADERAASRGLVRAVWVAGSQGVCVIALAAALYSVRGLLALVGLAVVVALTLEPVVSFLERHWVPRSLGVFLVVLLSCAALAGVVLGFIPPLKSEVSALDRATQGDLRHLLAGFRQGGTHGESAARPPAITGLTQWAGPVFGAVRSAAGGMATVVTVGLLAVLCLLFGKDLETLALSWLEPQRRERVERRLRGVRQAISRYVGGALAMSALGAVVTTLVLVAFHAPYFIVIGATMLVLGLIPTVGSLIGEVLVGLSTLQVGGPRRALLAVVIVVLYQTLAGNLLAPLVQGKALRMNPLLMMLVLLAGFQLGGVAGAILSLPIAAAAQVRIQEIKEARLAQWR